MKCCKHIVVCKIIYLLLIYLNEKFKFYKNSLLLNTFFILNNSLLVKFMYVNKLSYHFLAKAVLNTFLHY